MMPSSAHGDPQLGIDIHLCFTPVTVPLPSFHISVVFDPFDYLPFIGATVAVAGMKRAVAGTGGIDIHIPPGFPFAPMMPTWDDELFMGSSTVLADSEPLSYTALPVLGCQVLGMPSPPRLKKRRLRVSLLPTEVNLAIPKTVYVGGSPTISLLGLAFRLGLGMALRGVFAGLGKLAKSRAGKWLGSAFKKGRQKLFKNMKPGFMKCKVLRAEPVNILTGEVSVEQSDFTLPGRIPIEWIRTYASNDSRRGACGMGWETPADGRLEFDTNDGSVVFVYPDDGPAIFPQAPSAEGDEAAVLELMDGALLSDHGDEWRVRTKSDLIYHFPKSQARSVEAGLEEAPLGRISDLCGNWLEFQRRGGRLTAIRESAERYLRFDYQDGCISTITLYVPATDFTHTFVSYEYDEPGDLVAVRDALDNPYTFAYDDHHMIRHTNRTGLSFYYEYDKRGDEWQVIHSWGDGGLYDYRFDYWPEIRETRITDSLGHATTIKYNDMHLPILEIDPLGGRTIFEYDEGGRTTAVINPANHRFEFKYDACGNLISHIHPDGSSYSIDVNEQNKPIAITDPNGSLWRFDWDARGLQTHQHSPAGAVTVYNFDDSGMLVKAIDPNENSTLYGYDQYGNLSTITNALGNVSKIRCDELGNILSQTDSLGRRVLYCYDLNSRLIELTKPDGGKIHYTYNNEGDPIKHVSETGACTRFDYHGISLLSCRHEPDGQSVEYYYDTEERLIGVKNQCGNLYQLKRDALGRVVEEIDYWGQATEYNYDLAGYLANKRDALGRITSYTYDTLGRLLRKSFEHDDQPGELFEDHFTYDAAGNLIECKNENIVIQRRFDKEHRLIEEKQGDILIKNSYDKVGRRIKRETNIGNEITYGFDAMGRPISIGINESSKIVVERDAAGQITKEHLTDSMSRIFSYDNLGRVNSVAVQNGDNSLFKTHYKYDEIDNLVQRIDSSLGSESYHYSICGHISEHVKTTGAKQSFAQNPLGLYLDTYVIEEPALKVVGGSDFPATWQRVGKFNGTTYKFDRVGNLRNKDAVDHRSHKHTVKTNLNLTWNCNNQLIESVSLETKIKYKYDPLGRRIYKSGNEFCHRFFWDGDVFAGEIIESNSKTTHQNSNKRSSCISISEDTSKNKVREYVYYPDTFIPVILTEGSEEYYYHTDVNGSPTRLISNGGEIVWEGNYSALGNCNVHVSKIGNPLRLQGQYEDHETGLNYSRHRYYDSDIGQFVSFDPFGLSGGDTLEKYAPNTLAWIDPFGMTYVRSRHYSASQEGRKLHDKTQAYRGTHPDGLDGGRNFAAADVVVDGKPKTEFFVNDPGGMHSEQKLLAWEDTMKRKGHDIQVVRLYTERKPCGSLSANCTNTLAHRYGENMEVYHWRNRPGKVPVPCKR